MMKKWNAVILAGDRGLTDPVAKAANVPGKALAKLGDVTLIERIVRTLNEAECINQVTGRLIRDRYYSYFVREITHCLRQTDELLRVVRIERMYHRLWQLLLWLSKKFGTETHQGNLIDIRLTHQELADLLGSTRVTVTRLLNQMETEQKILRPGRFTIVLKTS